MGRSALPDQRREALVTGLTAEGDLGMTKMLERFDPNLGCRCSTYAPWGMRSSMQVPILQARTIVKIGATFSRRRRFLILRRVSWSRRETRECALPLHAVLAAGYDGRRRSDRHTNARMNLGKRANNILIEHVQRHGVSGGAAQQIRAGSIAKSRRNLAVASEI